MNSDTGLKDRLKILIAHEKPFAWAKRVGIPSPTFSRIWNEGGGLKSSHLNRIAIVTGCSVDWLLTGKGPMLAGDAVAEHVHQYIARTSPAELREFVVVPMMQGRISAGGGLVPDERVEMAVAFRREWIERKGDVEKMSVIRVYGESMVPTLEPGDIVLVNHGVGAVGAGGGIMPSRGRMKS